MHAVFIHTIWTELLCWTPWNQDEFLPGALKASVMCSHGSTSCLRKWRFYWKAVLRGSVQAVLPWPGFSLWFVSCCMIWWHFFFFFLLIFFVPSPRHKSKALLLSWQLHGNSTFWPLKLVWSQRRRVRSRCAPLKTFSRYPSLLSCLWLATRCRFLTPYPCRKRPEFRVFLNG